MLSDALADSIRARLFAHEFPAEAPLDEAALTIHYGVGHLALAKALEQLADERLLFMRKEGGYRIARYCRADIENLLDVLEGVRLFTMLRCMGDARGDCRAMAVDMPLESRRYWGFFGFVVALPFAAATKSLYEQLRMGIGPALTQAEAFCAERQRESMAQAIASGESGSVENFCRESARLFRQHVLSAFDGMQMPAPSK
jgi:DNA-binding GntR family transcriptional regulator